MTAKIVSVAESSPAKAAGIREGDILLDINGVVLSDILDYQIHSDSVLPSLLVDRDGRKLQFKIKKGPGENLGLTFESSVFDSLMTCNNRCVFCFIDQLPKGVRKNLLLKDDDFRHSFIYGNFITLTNLAGADIERVIAQRLSPLYVSIHSLNPLVRQNLIRPKGEDMAVDFLRRLSDAGIELHIQIVLCPGINDGKELRNTVDGLIFGFPSVASVGVVPVGLTGHRRGLYPLRPIGRIEAEELINEYGPYQEECLKEMGSAKVFLADEFYIITGKKLPDIDHYEDFPQLENGVGLTRLFLDSARDRLSELEGWPGKARAMILTGELAAGIVKELGKDLNGYGIDLEVWPIKNNFFGGGVSVTGLLTGWDIIKALKDSKEAGPFLLPGIVLNGEGRLLDDLTIDEVADRAKKRIFLVSSTGDGFISDLLKLCEDGELGDSCSIG
ncbi:MAG: DUF512 domain-containing protein [Actinomycetota bacterium]|nr:DUF512 domain-containing protein [Actinomycetota bacterium]